MRPTLGAAAALSIGAGFIHAAVIGNHTEHTTLAVLFVSAAVFQMGWGFAALLRPSRWLAAVGAVGNLAAFGAWFVTRLTSVSWIDGLDHRESVGFTDTVCALLGLGAALAAGLALVDRKALGRVLALAPIAALVTVLAVPAVFVNATSPHSHDDGDAAHEHDDGDDHAHDEGEDHDHGDDPVAEPRAQGAATVDRQGGDEHEHDDGDDHAHDSSHEHDPSHDHGDGGDHGGDGQESWPRSWDPSEPIDVSGVGGVTPKQEQRAVALIATTMRDLPRWADPATAEADGYTSIGDAGTGYEHYLDLSRFDDGKFLDSTSPESLVYEVDGDDRTLVSAMYIAEPEYLGGSKKLEKVLGALASWHMHDNLCWTVTDAGPKVVGTNDDGPCPEGSFLAGGEFPMVHVWIAPHECGPFAALEGTGAGTTGDDQDRVDQCDHDHGGHGGDGDHGDGTEAGHGDGHDDHGEEQLADWPRPWDPDEPIDIPGEPAVTGEQQALANQLIEDSLRDLPRWADPETAFADGYRSIGDAGTGHEHYINWDYLDDGAFLDSTRPESLVYEVYGGGRTLVSAMYLAEPEWDYGSDELDQLLGPLASWHVHDNLCWVDGPHGAPRVGGLTNSEGECRAGTYKMVENRPMVHVWIAPHECGPFAALEGVGAGQTAEGDARVDQCDSHEH